MNSDMDAYLRVHGQAAEWVDEALRLGWLHRRDADAFARLETGQAGDLFEPATQRPLVVALFGGTGVGKSSLLNRLAGRAIAEVGVVRPTSNVVTLYLHESYRDSLHEQALPTEDTRVIYHGDDSQRFFAWLDMPDIDSTAQANREIVEAWLPLVDWLIYVVTPERYQDDQGWRFVQARGHRHAWLFVINHWDEAAGPEWEDFRLRLEQRGFAQPTVLKTSCVAAVPDDDFGRLRTILAEALDAHGVQGIVQALMQRRWAALDAELDACRQRLWPDPHWNEVKRQWDEAARSMVTVILERANMNADLLHRYWLAQEESRPGYMPPTNLSAGDSGAGAPENSPGAVVDALFRSTLKEQMNGFENRMLAIRMPAAPLDVRLAPLPEAIEQAFSHAIGNAVAHALRNPGTFWLRKVREVLARLRVFLPAAAGGWAAWHTVHQFYLGTRGEGAFLGLDFAIHSALLVGLAWLIPWYLYRQTRPSYVATVDLGVRNALARAGEATRARIHEAWDSLSAERAGLLVSLSRLMQPQRPETEEAEGVLRGFSAPRYEDPDLNLNQPAA